MINIHSLENHSTLDPDVAIKTNLPALNKRFAFHELLLHLTNQCTHDCLNLRSRKMIICYVSFLNLPKFKYIIICQDIYSLVALLDPS